MREWTGLEKLSEGCLYELAQDAMYRIGSCGENSGNYVKHQQGLLDAIAEELERRG